MKNKVYIFLAVCTVFCCEREVLGQNTYLDSSDCAQLQWSTHLLSQGSDFQKMYDSAKYTVEHCAIYDVSPHIWADFGEATNGLQDLNKDPNRWPQYREWLKKGLYLNVDTNYYCSDVNAILSTMQLFNEVRGLDRNGSLAIIKFLRDSNRCMGWYFMAPQVWTQTRQDQYTTWRDTAKNPKLNPLDTTLPSLEDLDLQVLRGPQYAAVKDAFMPTSITKIRYLNVSENPFKSETTLLFGLADDEYMRVDIYDLLGNKVYSDTKLLGEGDKEWRIDGKSLAGGSLYARLSTMGGEVKTVKLMHE